MTELLIIRHGRTQLNELGIKQGVIDSPATQLTATGRTQARQLARVLPLQGAAALFVSPLRRACQTAAILNERWQLPVIVDQRLVEISYGDWDGQPNATLQQQYPACFDPLINDVRPSYAAVAHGETFAHVQARVAQFTQMVAQRYPNARVVIVTHGFTVRSFAANVVGCAALEILEPANCSVTKIMLDPATHEQHLVYYNRTATPQF